MIAPRSFEIKAAASSHNAAAFCFFALRAAPNPEELRMAMSGITISDGGIV